MNSERIAEAASLLVAARQSRMFIPALPASAAPRNVGEAHAIQDEVTRRLCLAVGGYKGAGPKDGAEGRRGSIYVRTILASPAIFPSAEAPRCGVESEIAFRFRRDLPSREVPYSREEVADSVEACPVIEVVSSRFAVSSNAPTLDRIADCISNGGLVVGPACADWRKLDFNRMKVRLVVNGETAVEKIGGHPAGDPLGVAVALVELMRGAGGVKAGQYATTSSWTGLPYYKPGDHCRAVFEGLGEAEVVFTPLGTP